MRIESNSGQSLMNNSGMRLNRSMSSQNANTAAETASGISDSLQEQTRQNRLADADQSSTLESRMQQSDSELLALDTEATIERSSNRYDMPLISSSALNNTNTSASGAESRIKDVDINSSGMRLSSAGTSTATSAETDSQARLGRLNDSSLQAAQGYQQANVSQMAQANQSSQGILNLFG